MRNESLSAVKGGITRLRDKGSPPKDWLYDLVNGYVTAARSIRNRPGTTIHTVLPPGTKGLCGFDGKLHVFAGVPVEMTDSRYVCHTLRHPTDLGRPLAEIHFSAPFMGRLYVVAEFDNGDIYHYWLEEIDEWEASTVYQFGDRVIPTVPNGYMYEATRLGSPNPVWAAGVLRTVDEVIEPTESNGYYYTVIDTTGANPASGATEPDWIAADGAIVVELTDGDPAPAPTPAVDDEDPGTGGYTNPGGSRPGLGREGIIQEQPQ